MHKNIVMAFIFGAAALVVSPATAATSLRTSSALGPSHISAATHQVFLDKLKELTGGRYTGQNFTSGLVTLPEMLGAVKSGIVDVGNIALPYYPADLPETNLPSELALMSSNGIAAAGADAEYIFTCAECQAELRKFNGVYLAGASSAAFDILSTRPVATLADMKGLKIRTGAASHTRWAAALGATSVQMSASEVFEGLNQGILDATYASFDEYVSLRLSDVITNVTLTDLGTFSGISPFTLRQSIWASLSKEDKANFLKAAQWGAAEFTIGSIDKVRKGKELAQSKGVKLVELNEEFRKANDDFLDQDAKLLEKNLTDKGVKNAGEKIARFTKLLKKWTKLSEGVETREQFVDLMMSEVISKIDLDKYGME